jgi:hypothetical protein
MKLVDLSNPRHQQILIEEIARAKRIIAETRKIPTGRKYNYRDSKGQIKSYPIYRDDEGHTYIEVNNTIVPIDNNRPNKIYNDILSALAAKPNPFADMTQKEMKFYMRWGIGGPKKTQSDGDDNNNGYPDATENPLQDDDGMFVTKGHTGLHISAEDRDAFLAGDSVFATDSDGESYEINRNMVNINWSSDEKKTYSGQEILSHPEFAKLPETRSDVDWKNRPQVYLPSLDTADARMQVVSKDDLTGSEVQGPKMVHRFPGYLKVFESKFGEAPIFIDVDHKYLGKIIDIQNPKFIAWRDQGLAAKGAYMDAARKRGNYGHD